MRTPLIFALVLLGLCLNCFVVCQELPSDRNWDFSIWSSVATGEENTNSFSEAQIVRTGIFAGRILTRRRGTGWTSGALEYGFSLAPVFVQLRPETLHGVAFEPITLRWNSGHRAGTAVPYIELAGGGLHTNANLPAGDTSNFNFTARGGAGVSFQNTSSHALDLALSWSHISNANLGRRNPEFNAIELRVTYHWFR